MKSQHVTFPCHDITLEGVIHIPDATGPLPAVAVCHPHPLYGGDMDNNVVMAACDGLAEQAIICLRFNFRGAGGSGGVFGGGLGEREDVKAALDFLGARKEVDSRRLGLVGYSFGGGVAFAAAQQDDRVKAIALISPALGGGGWEHVNRLSIPKLILAGDMDTVVHFPRQNLEDKSGFHVISGADHSWWGFEDRISTMVGEFFKGALR